MTSVIKYFKNLEIVVGVINSKKIPSNSEKVDMLVILGESHGNYEAAIPTEELLVITSSGILK
jgi:hypothetical protein